MGKQTKRGGKQQFSQPDDLDGKPEEEEETEQKGGKSGRGLGGQSANAGMMPPSDSDSDEESEDDAPAKGQNKNAGMMPPSDSDEDDEDDGPPPPKVRCEGVAHASCTRPAARACRRPRPRARRPLSHARGGRQGKKAAAPVELTRKEREQLEAQKEPEVDPEVARKQMAQLELVKKRRAEQAAKRVAADGWDRYAPVTETNRPPGSAWPPPDQAA